MQELYSNKHDDDEDDEFSAMRQVRVGIVISDVPS